MLAFCLNRVHMTRPAHAVQVRGTPSLAIFDGATGELLTPLGAADVSDPGALADPLAVVGRWCALDRDNSEFRDALRCLTLKADEDGDGNCLGRGGGGYSWPCMA